ncbi:MAG TPA: hypothetical protein VGO93_20260 [Candidatus Xenobia bacterium]|jgi:hypothetical protein
MSATVSAVSPQPDITRPRATPVAAEPSHPQDSVTVGGDAGRPTLYQQGRQVFNDVTSTGIDATNAAFGIDPNLSTLAGLNLTYNAVQGISFIPKEALDFFGKYAFPAFCVAAPVLDSLKLANTWKMSKAMGQLKDPKATGLKAVMKSGNIVNLATDALHLGLDVACSAALIGVGLHFAPLAFMSAGLAMKLGLCGAIGAGAVHGYGAVASLSDPSQGQSLSARWRKFINTQSGTALLHRVFQNEEPLLGAPDGPAAPPDNGDPGAAAKK